LLNLGYVKWPVSVTVFSHL